MKISKIIQLLHFKSRKLKEKEDRALKNLIN